MDATGSPTAGMGLFNAFYVISYTATTIGFGELPVPWSTGQRMWMTLSNYLTVTGWSYAVVTVVGLFVLMVLGFITGRGRSGPEHRQADDQH